MSEVAWARLAPSTYSYLKPMETLWAPLLPVGTARMGTSRVWLSPAPRAG